MAWSLFNERSHIQIDDLTAEQAWKIIASEDPKTRAQWQVWQDGRTRWMAVSDFDAAQDYIREVSALPFTHPAVPGLEDRLRAEEEREIGTFDFNGEAAAIDVLDDSDTAVNEGRSHRRFRQSYRVEIELEGRRFVTHSVDISLGGMRMEENLPPTEISSFLARIIHEGGSSLYLRCFLVDVTGLHRDRVRFANDDAKMAILRTWLLEHPTTEE